MFLIEPKWTAVEIYYRLYSVLKFKYTNNKEIVRTSNGCFGSIAQQTLNRKTL
ncbi:hypothetical protein VCR12J2_560103 [Vibrio coralliirubri]|nr:hypothetical protein VCR12J2_560103 [Vibrio coralliirubri]